MACVSPLHPPSLTYPPLPLLPLQATLALVAKVQQGAGITETSLLNFVVSDGHTLIASRCVFPEDGAAASLYYSEGSAFQRTAGGSELPSDAAQRQGGSGPSISQASARDSSVTGDPPKDSLYSPTCRR